MAFKYLAVGDTPFIFDIGGDGGEVGVRGESVDDGMR